MEEIKRTNYCLLRGAVVQPPCFSHEGRGEQFYQFPMEVCRLSGVADVINVVVRHELAERLEVEEGKRLCVSGELRSFNNKSKKALTCTNAMSRESFINKSSIIHRGSS